MNTKRVWVLVSVCTLLLAGLMTSYKLVKKMDNQEQVKPAVEVIAHPVELILRRTYICGMKEEEKKQLTGSSLQQILARYAGWEIVSLEKEKLVLHKQVDDISPACKKNGYFGLTPEGILTLFYGLPKDNKVIQTFYQINTKRLEASLPPEEVALLKKGIRVRDLAEYNSILSTYGDFQYGSELKAH
jgi:forespore regulator of the sigma-K checkpoint